MAELVDAPGLGPGGLTLVEVRVLSSALGETTEQTTKVESQQARAVLNLAGRRKAGRELFCTSVRAFKHRDRRRLGQRSLLGGRAE